MAFANLQTRYETYQNLCHFLVYHWFEVGRAQKVDLLEGRFWWAKNFSSLLNLQLSQLAHLFVQIEQVYSASTLDTTHSFNETSVNLRVWVMQPFNLKVNEGVEPKIGVLDFRILHFRSPAKLEWFYGLSQLTKRLVIFCILSLQVSFKRLLRVLHLNWS